MGNQRAAAGTVCRAAWARITCGERGPALAAPALSPLHCGVAEPRRSGAGLPLGAKRIPLCSKKALLAGTRAGHKWPARRAMARWIGEGRARPDCTTSGGEGEASAMAVAIEP